MNRRSYANGVIKANDVLCVNWLSSHQRGISDLFAGVGAVPMRDRFDHGKWRTLSTGAPYSEAAAFKALLCQTSRAQRSRTPEPQTTMSNRKSHI